ncbi:hypothetical protein Bbelb_306270 [Branchiostoma belcheri]|nr:hypothetical protein Bbelb_306270 [Branchiostoma belcheri]
MEEEPEPAPNVTGVVLVVVSTAVFALAESCFGLCTAAGVQTSHLLLFRSVCLFTINLGAMAFVAVGKSCGLKVAQPSFARMKSRLPILILVGMATTVTTVITPMSYLFDIPIEAYQGSIFALAPVYTTAIAYCLLSESFSHEKFWAMAVSVVGSMLYVISVPKPKSGPHTSMAIYLVALFLSPLLSAAFVSARALLKKNLHPITLVFAVQLCSILYLVPFDSKFVYEALSYGNVPEYGTDVWMAAIGHVVCYSTASYLLYFGLKYEKAGIVQILLTATIPFSLLLNFVMFGRVPFPSEGIGGALAAVGVAALVVMTCFENKLCNGINCCYQVESRD